MNESKVRSDRTAHGEVSAISPDDEALNERSQDANEKEQWRLFEEFLQHKRDQASR